MDKTLHKNILMILIFIIVLEPSFGLQFSIEKTSSSKVKFFHRSPYYLNGNLKSESCEIRIGDEIQAQFDDEMYKYPNWMKCKLISVDDRYAIFEVTRYELRLRRNREILLVKSESKIDITGLKKVPFIKHKKRTIKWDYGTIFWGGYRVPLDTHRSSIDKKEVYYLEGLDVFLIRYKPREEITREYLKLHDSKRGREHILKK